MMIFYDSEGNTNPITCYENLHIKHKADGNDEMSFLIPTSTDVYKTLGEETQIDYGDNEWLIKKIDDDQIDCRINFDFLKQRAYTNLKISSKPLAWVLEQYLPSGWTVHNANIVGDVKTFTIEAGTDYDVIYSCVKTYSVYYVWKTLTKDLYVFSQDAAGLPNAGEYIAKELNLRALSFKGESTDFATRLYAIGADGLTMESAIVNGSTYGKKYVDNNQYSDKVVSVIWKDERYTVAQNLYDEAVKKLANISFPVRSYECKVNDLAKQNANFEFLQFKMHYKAILLDPERKTRTELKVVEYDEYPDEPSNNVVTLSCVAGTIQSYVNKTASTIKEEVERLDTSFNERVSAASTFLMSAFGTYRFEDDNGNIYFADNANLDLAESVWLLNSNGLGHSSTGKNGPFTTTLTANDQLTTSVINAMIVRGAYIEAGSITAEKISQSYTDDVVEQVVEIAEGHITAELSNIETGLRTYVDTEAGSLRSEFETADSALRNAITVNQNGLEAEIIDRTTAESALQAAIKANTTQISTLLNRVDEFAVGSRNLLLDSACFETRSYTANLAQISNATTSEEPSLPSGKAKSFTIKASANSANCGIEFYSNSSNPILASAQNIKKNAKYTLSFYAKVNEGTRDYTLKYSSGSSAETRASGTITTEWKRFVHRLTTSSSVPSPFYIKLHFAMDSGTSLVLSLSSIQLEESTIPSDWHENVGELKEKFLNVDDFQTVLGDNIGSFLSDYVTNSDVTSLRQEFNSSITQTNEAIALKADSSTVTTLQNTVNGHTTLINNNSAAIETKATQILSTVSSQYYLKSSATTLESNLKNYADNADDIVYANAKSYIDQQANSIRIAVEENIEVGAENLLYDTGCFKHTTCSPQGATMDSGYPSATGVNGNEYAQKLPSHEYCIFKYTCSSSGNIGARFTHSDSNKVLSCNMSEFKANKKYVLTFWMSLGTSLTIDRTKLMRVEYDNNGTQASMAATFYEGSDTLINCGTSWRKYKFVFSFPHVPNRFTLAFIHTGTAGTSYQIRLSSLKLESGTVPTDWRLSGADVSASIDMCVKTDGNGNLVSAIAISANRISITSDNFTLTNDGKITAKSGTVGGWSITSNAISSEFVRNGTTYTTYLQTPTGSNKQYVTTGLGSKIIGIRTSSDYIFGVSPEGTVDANGQLRSHEGLSLATDSQWGYPSVRGFADPSKNRNTIGSTTYDFSLTTSDGIYCGGVIRCENVFISSSGGLVSLKSKLGL